MSLKETIGKLNYCPIHHGTTCPKGMVWMDKFKCHVNYRLYLQVSSEEIASKFNQTETSLWEFSINVPIQKDRSNIKR